MPARRMRGPVAPPACRSRSSCPPARSGRRSMPAAGTARASSCTAPTSARPSPRLERIRDAEGLTFVHPFDDPAVIAGNGTTGPGARRGRARCRRRRGRRRGGGLISGVAAAVKARRPEPRRRRRARALQRPVAGARADEIVRIQPTIVADGLGAPFAGEWTLAMARRYVDDRSCCSTTRRSLPGCASRSSDSSRSSSLPAPRPWRQCSRGGSRSRTASGWRCPVGRERRGRPAWASCSNARRPCPERPRDGRTTGRARPAESVDPVSRRSIRTPSHRPRAHPARTSRHHPPDRTPPGSRRSRRAVVTARRTTARRTADIRPTAVGHVPRPPGQIDATARRRQLRPARARRPRRCAGRRSTSAWSCWAPSARSPSRRWVLQVAAASTGLRAKTWPS